jgi:hypothetical protein
LVDLDGVVSAVDRPALVLLGLVHLVQAQRAVPRDQVALQVVLQAAHLAALPGARLAAHLVAFLEAPAALPQAAWVLRDRALLQVAHPVVFLAELQAKALAKTLAKTLASLE